MTLFGLSAVALTLSCAQKKDTTDADLVVVEKPTLTTVKATDEQGNEVGFATYDYITGHAVNETKQADGMACPNCSFTEFTSDAKFLFTLDPSKKPRKDYFQTSAAYELAYPNDNPKDDVAVGEIITQAVPAAVRNTPKGFLNPRYAQTYQQAKLDGFGFDLLTLLGIGIGGEVPQATFKYGGAKDLVIAVDGGGVKLKNIKGSIAVVKGQLTNGMVRSWHATSNTGGFIAAKDKYVDKKMIELGFANTDNFSSRPDAIQIKFAYKPTGSDKASFEFLFFDATSVRRLPAQTKGYKGGASQEYIVVDKRELGYVRVMVKEAGDIAGIPVTVKVPVYYRDQTGKPQGLLMNISAGDGYDAKENSELLVKSIEFCYGNVCK